MGLPSLLVGQAIRDALAEDLGLAGDITTNPIVSPDTEGAAAIVAREQGIVAGLDLAETAFRTLDPDVRFSRIVDDGSRDSSFAVLQELGEKDSRVKVVRFRRNFGKSTGLSVGFAEASGDVLITMDADLQDDPEEIPNLLAKLDEGYDLSEYGFDARVVCIPGHSKGSIGILTANDDLLCGDLFENTDKPVLNSLMDSLAAANASLEKLANLEINTVFPGHGEPFSMEMFLKNHR